MFKTKFKEVTSHYQDFKHIYTDGSKDGPKVAAACVSDTTPKMPDNATIFSAESQAINTALDYIEENNLSKGIFSDSLSVLQSIKTAGYNITLTQHES